MVRSLYSPKLMKFHFLLLSIFLSFSSVQASAILLTLNGKVTDAVTKEPLIGATITLPDLRINVSTDVNGLYTFKNLPSKGRFLVEVKYVGYKTFTSVIDLSVNQKFDFALQPSMIEAREVVVTGFAISSDNRKNSTSVTSINKDHLINRASGNLVDAISKVPGVSQISTGGGISKPVIRGLSYNRVVTLVDGAKQEGQQWGDEHGIEVDQFGADRVEVLRGAASLMYGSDALGGVINILDPLPSPEGQMRGEVVSNYQTNNGLTGSSAMLQGNQNGFVWRARTSYKNAYSYNAPGGRIANTGYNETDFSTQLGLNKRWGYTNLNLSSFKNNVGLPDFQRNENGYFEDNNGNILTNSDLKSRTLFMPFQDIRHYKAAINSNILFGDSKLRFTLAYQNNQRRELANSRVTPSLFFDLKTYSGDFKFHFSENKGWEPVIGLSGSYQKNENRANEFLIPDYNSKDFGVFVYTKKSWTNSTFNIGARFDARSVTGKKMTEADDVRFNDFKTNFSNFTGALGFTHEFNEQFSFKANLASAFRAPNIAELSANGVHEGTFRYEIGDNNLKPENSFSTDLGFEYNSDKVHAGLGVFNNYIDHYIYSRQLNNEIITVGADDLPVFRFVQDNANLAGLEASLTLHPVELIHFENSFSFTRGVNRATDKPLPFIPAGVLRNELRLEPKFKGNIKNTYLSVGLDNVFKQNRIDNFETETNGYTLVNAAVGTTFMLKKQPLRLNVSANNLLDKAYYDHLSRFKPGRLDETNPTVGYYNQGRNISIGFYLPFVVK
ncbi:MAG: TonB-dependent receptor [Sphingobacteriales bacterium]|nr:TonB-dependent receptor [Sphingobacteriales bacterium]